MVWHLVLMKPRPDLPAAERQGLIEAFERACRDIPGIVDVQVGQRVTHGAGYESDMPDSADYVAAIAFGDLAALRAYLQHPAHEELGARFNRSLSSALVYDFEMGGIER